MDSLNKQVSCGEGTYRFMQTPHMDRIRQEGVCFDQAFVQFPTCVPSRASIATGKYPHQLGIFNHQCGIPQCQKTAADYFNENGYETVAIGRTHGQDKGFQMRVPNQTGIKGFGTNSLGNGADSDSIVSTFTGELEEQHDMHAALGFPQYLADKQSDQPFFAHVGFMAPHTPYWPPVEFDNYYSSDNMQLPSIEDSERQTLNSMQRYIAENRWLKHPPSLRKKILAKYCDLVSYVDACIGKIITSLEENNLLDETIIVLTSDHGDMIGEHEMIAKWFSHYDEAMRTPLFIRFPDGYCTGKRFDQLVEMIDLAPTLLDLCVRQKPAFEAENMTPCRQSEEDRLPGKSLLPLLRGNDAFHKQAVFCMNENGYTIRTKHFKLTLYATRTCFGYPDALFTDSDDAGDLFELSNDPGEHVNLYDNPSYTAIKAQLATQLVQHQIKHHHWLGPVGENCH